MGINAGQCWKKNPLDAAKDNDLNSDPPTKRLAAAVTTNAGSTNYGVLFFLLLILFWPWQLQRGKTSEVPNPQASHLLSINGIALNPERRRSGADRVREGLRSECRGRVWSCSRDVKSNALVSIEHWSIPEQSSMAVFSGWHFLSLKTLTRVVWLPTSCRGPVRDRAVWRRLRQARLQCR